MMAKRTDSILRGQPLAGNGRRINGSIEKDCEPLPSPE